MPGWEQWLCTVLVCGLGPGLMNTSVCLCCDSAAEQSRGSLWHIHHPVTIVPVSPQVFDNIDVDVTRCLTTVGEGSRMLFCKDNWQAGWFLVSKDPKCWLLMINFAAKRPNYMSTNCVYALLEYCFNHVYRCQNCQIPHTRGSCAQPLLHQ